MLLFSHDFVKEEAVFVLHSLVGKAFLTVCIVQGTRYFEIGVATEFKGASGYRQFQL